MNSSSNPFDHCPGYYLPDFYQFKTCTNVFDFCDHARDIYNIEMLLRWAIFVIPCFMCLFALFLDVYIFWVLIPNLRKMNDRSKKKYVFILSRAISSTMSIVSIFLLPIILFLTHFNFWIIALFIIFEMLSFLSLLGGIAGTTLTIYVAVVHPVYYTREMSLRKCVFLLFLLWFCAISVAIFCGIVEAAFIGEYAPFLCDYSNCAEPVLIFAIVCISIGFILCLGTQSFVIFSLWRHEKKSKKRGDYSSTQKALTGIKRKLFGGFFVFGTMAVFEIASAIMLVNNIKKQNQGRGNEEEYGGRGGISDVDPCDMLAASGSRLQFVIYCVILTLLWTIGLFFDPIFTLSFDPLFTETVTRHYSIMKSRISRKQRKEKKETICYQ
uniref:G_PROTEIN_RECEP_F1_2 domain-containing protein n=1 Tax=Caenorhabditis tropicalis TaxID=1561998 RepID=A0A1I7TB34_9PELO